MEIAAEGQTAATTRLWRFRGQLRVTVIVKATFALVHQGLMKIGPPDPVVTAEVHHGNNPVRSVRFTSDLAPYLPSTDVLLTGHAYAPAGERAAWVTAGIAILDGYEPIFEKYLDVRGDTRADGIHPFQKVPLLYERAFGGPGWEDNPYGVGAGGAKGEPNIFYIGDRRRSAGFGPLSAHWPARKKLISNEVRKALAAPIAEIPEGFDWTYFQAAPADQRCRFFAGTEWLVLQGVRPDQRRVRSRLPGVKARALVFWAGEAPEQEPLELIGDTLRVDSDRGVCSATWRKSFAVADETDLAHLRVLAGVEIGGQPISWSLPGSQPKGPVAREEPPAFVRKTTANTVTLSDADLEIVSLDVDESGAAEHDSSSPRPLPPAVQLAAPPPPAPDTPAPPGAPQAPAESPRPMILGSFRLAVFSPDYEEDPDDPLLSTLVIRNRPSSFFDRLKTTQAMPAQAAPPEPLGGTQAMPARAAPPEPLKSTVVMQDSADVQILDDIVDDPSATTLVLRNKPPPAGAGVSAARPLGDLAAPPESTTGVLPARGAPPPPRVGLAGTMVIDDEDTEDTGPPPPDALDPIKR